MKERVIVTLTTWHKRIRNIPVVLDTIFCQTIPPDVVVLNLSYEETIPAEVQNYIDSHNIEVNRVPDTKVYKKLIPTLKKYPNDCIINIDDDWLYPEEMIADFMDIHEKYPEYPISGNRVIYQGMQCHCGCASLTKASFFGEYIDKIDQEIMSNCPSDDMVFTYFANLANHPYIRTKDIYFINMESYNEVEGYSDSIVGNDPIKLTYEYLVKRFDKIDNWLDPYIHNDYLVEIINDICNTKMHIAQNIGANEGALSVYSSFSYRVGHNILEPFIWLKSLLARCVK